MLRAGKVLRFTPDEIEIYRKLGLDFDGARTQDDIEQALAQWADTLNDERPDLLEKIAVEMAKAKGIPLPARLLRVRRCPGPAVVLGNPNPTVGDPVQIDQVTDFDLARLSQAGDDFLDQDRVVLGQLNHGGGDAPAVEDD